MKLPLKEPLSARYLYVSPENIVHVFMPIVSGTSIGLDNTCKAVFALQEFFNKGSNSNKKSSLKGELLAYKEALESDISLLEAHSELAQQKQERLNQIDAYIKVFTALEKHQELACLDTSFPSYPRPLEGMMQDRNTSNLYSMVLRPSEQDGYLRSEGANPIFHVAHRSVSRQIGEVESLLQKSLIATYTSLTFNDLKAEVTNQVLKALNGAFKLEHLRDILQDTVQKVMNVSIDFTKTSQGVPITQDYIDKAMLFDEKTKPEEYIDALTSYPLIDHKENE